MYRLNKSNRRKGNAVEMSPYVLELDFPLIQFLVYMD